MGKPHAKRKAEIIQCTLDLAAENGVKKVTTQAIADRVGIAQATVFRHFKSRDAIFIETLEWLAAQLFKTLSPSFNGTEPADKRLNMLIERQLKFINKHRGLPRVLFSDRLHIESPVLKSVVQKILARYLTQVATIIEAGMLSGCFKKNLDTQQVATMVAALIQGSVMRWSIFDFNFDLENEAEAIKGFVNQSISTVGETDEADETR